MYGRWGVQRQRKFHKSGKEERERESKKRTECSVNSAAGAQVCNIVNTFTAPSLQYCSKLEEVCSVSTAIALKCQLDAFTLITMLTSKFLLYALTQNFVSRRIETFLRETILYFKFYCSCSSERFCSGFRSLVSLLGASKQISVFKVSLRSFFSSVVFRNHISLQACQL